MNRQQVTTIHPGLQDHIGKGESLRQAFPPNAADRCSFLKVVTSRPITSLAVAVLARVHCGLSESSNPATRMQKPSATRGWTLPLMERLVVGSSQFAAAETSVKLVMEAMPATSEPVQTDNAAETSISVTTEAKPC